MEFYYQIIINLCVNRTTSKTTDIWTYVYKFISVENRLKCQVRSKLTVDSSSVSCGIITRAYYLVFLWLMFQHYVFEPFNCIIFKLYSLAVFYTSFFLKIILDFTHRGCSIITLDHCFLNLLVHVAFHTIQSSNIRSLTYYLLINIYHFNFLV